MSNQESAAGAGSVAEERPAQIVARGDPSRGAGPDDTARALALVGRLARDEPLLRELEPFLERPTQEVVATAAEHTPAAIVEVTRAVYRRDWQDFCQWCRANDADPNGLPVNPVIVAAYLAVLAPKQSRSALRRRTAAIAWHHHQCGVAFPASHPVIRETLRGICRRHAKPVRPVAPLSSREVRQLIATCPVNRHAKGTLHWSGPPEPDRVRQLF